MCDRSSHRHRRLSDILGAVAATSAFWAVLLLAGAVLHHLVGGA